MRVLLISTFVLLGFLGCKHGEQKPQDPVVIVKPPVEPTPPAVVDGHWCVSGGGFSPCAPHSALIDKACSIGQQVESDCKMWSCLAKDKACQSK